MYNGIRSQGGVQYGMWSSIYFIVLTLIGNCILQKCLEMKSGSICSTVPETTITEQQKGTYSDVKWVNDTFYK